MLHSLVLPRGLTLGLAAARHDQFRDIPQNFFEVGRLVDQVDDILIGSACSEQRQVEHEEKLIPLDPNDSLLEVLHDPLIFRDVPNLANRQLRFWTGIRDERVPCP